MPERRSFVEAFIIAVFIFVLGGQSSAQNSVPYLTEPAISPDNKEIAFVSGGDIWTVSSSGGTAQLLISHEATEGRPAYSPDGKKLAFTSTRTGNGDIYVLDFATNALTRITFNDTSDNLDAWSKDGTWLYFYASNQDIAGMNDIFRVRATGGTPLAVSNDLYTNEFFAAPSPDGASLAFSARGISNGQWWRNGRSHIDETELWVKQGSDYREIASRGAKQHWTMWSPDGSTLYYGSDRSGAQNIWSQPKTGNAKQLTDFKSGRVLWASISYDGKDIVFERDFKIWKLDTKSGRSAPVPITLRGNVASPATSRMDVSSDISEIAVSPDGKKIAVVARGEVFAATADEGDEAVRVSETAAPESFASWSSDSKRVVYSSERSGKLQLFEYDFASEKETQLTSLGNDYAAVYSTDGDNIAFLRNGREIWVYDRKKKQERKLANTYTDIPPLAGKRTFAWSPDNQWIAFLTLTPENRSYTNVSVVSLKGNDAKPISFIANSFSGTISWSPDGEYILFDSTQRTETPSLARIALKLRTPKFNEDKFRDLFEQENPQEKPKPTPTPVAPTTTESPAPPVTPTAGDAPATAPKKPDDKKKKTEIEFEDIRKRLSLIDPGVSINEHVISPDGKTLLVTAAAEGSFNLYTISLEELERNRSAKQITSSPTFKSDAQFSPDSKSVYYIENGRVRNVDLARGNIRSLPLSLGMKVDFNEEKMQIFDQGWRYMRDHFYDPAFHGTDWNAVYKTYEPLIRGSKNMDEMRRLMNMMVGELNASHLGVSGSSDFRGAPIGRLGLRFDRAEYEANGRLKITEIITLSPAAVSKEIKTGDYLLSIDKKRIDGSTNIDELLENKVGSRVEIEISNSSAGTNPKKIVLKPISTGAEKQLLYRQWVESNRDYVDRISGGKLGYIHLPDMGSGTLAQVYVDLDVINQKKQGVVVDIRNNNGGFINPYVIDIFARQSYLTMQERGLWQYPARSALGQRALERPTILVTNQHSLSDAEDLTEGYRTLKIGKVVGEKTSGWIIFTWSPTLFDGTRFRLPRSKITDNRGQNMELNPRPVDVEVIRPIGETYTNKDSQLDSAVNELLRQIGSGR
ncbi:MAG: S41 family peptidase [Pyrinomonadaceae bacterium]